MKYELFENNKVFLNGVVVDNPVFSHETYGEGFYNVKLSVPRLSKNNDVLSLTVSEKMIKDFIQGQEVAIKGQFRSFNKFDGEKSRLVLNVFAQETVKENDKKNSNLIELVGFLCKPPIFRTTPFEREICDILVAVNRAYNKSDYLPCIAWGRNARYIKDAKVGSKLEIVGRIQSREYQKRLPSGEFEIRTAYEVSIIRLNIIENGDVEI